MTTISSSSPTRAYVVRNADDAIVAATDPSSGEPMSLKRANELARAYGKGFYISSAGRARIEAPARDAGDEIVYDPSTRDFAFYVGGELQGWARTYQEAEAQRDALVMEQAERAAA